MNKPGDRRLSHEDLQGGQKLLQFSAGSSQLETPISSQDVRTRWNRLNAVSDIELTTYRINSSQCLSSVMLLEHESKSSSNAIRRERRVSIFFPIGTDPCISIHQRRAFSRKVWTWTNLLTSMNDGNFP